MERWYLKSPGNSGWLNVTFTDLRDPNEIKQKQSTFYDQKQPNSSRNLNINLAEMELTMLHGGQISVTHFSNLYLKD